MWLCDSTAQLWWESNHSSVCGLSLMLRSTANLSTPVELSPHDQSSLYLAAENEIEALDLGSISEAVLGKGVYVWSSSACAYRPSKSLLFEPDSLATPMSPWNIEAKWLNISAAIYVTFAILVL